MCACYIRAGFVARMNALVFLTAIDASEPIRDVMGKIAGGEVPKGVNKKCQTDRNGL